MLLKEPTRCVLCTPAKIQVMMLERCLEQSRMFAMKQPIKVKNWVLKAKVSTKVSLRSVEKDLTIWLKIKPKELGRIASRHLRRWKKLELLRIGLDHLIRHRQWELGWISLNHLGRHRQLGIVTLGTGT